MLMLELAVNVIVVQVAPGANTLRSPDLAEYMDLHFQKKRGDFQFSDSCYDSFPRLKISPPFWALNIGPVASQWGYTPRKVFLSCKNAI